MSVVLHVFLLVDRHVKRRDVFLDPAVGVRGGVRGRGGVLHVCEKNAV